MKLKGKKIGFVITGSFGMFRKTIEEINKILKEEADILPIMSYNAYNLDTKFGKARDFINEIQKITGKEIIHNIQEAEPIGYKHMTDVMVIMPATGNTISKLANDIIDTPATMAVKSHLRNNLPLVVAPVTNNGLGANAENIGKLLNKTNYYFVPFRQDNPITKPRSITFDSQLVIRTIEMAMDGEQMQPLLL